MQLYIYDVDRQLVGVVESFEYLRWTRRYSVCGGFELKAVVDANNLALLKMDHIVWKNDDEEAAVIEYIELTDSILVRGRFITGILGRRIVWGTETLRGDLSECVSQLITKHLINPVNIDRKIASCSISSPRFDIRIDTQTSYRNLLAVVEGLCDAADAGIKTVWNPESRQYIFTLYQGADSQAVFSREYENLTEQSYIHSLLSYANVALVGGEGEGAERVTVMVGSGSGPDRYEAFVDAKDLQRDDFGEDYPLALVQRGQNKLAECPVIRSFDAAINPYGNLWYKEDYDVGQTVRVLSKAWGVTLKARITEIEETYDLDGRSIQVAFGRGLLTFAQRLKGGV